MKNSYKSKLVKILVLFLSVSMGLVLAGCAAGLFPQFTYQGRLTDQDGNPLSGNFSITYRFFHASSGGTSFYTDTNSVTVTDGLFDAVVGPASATGNLSPKELSEPIWIEVQVANGVYTETLTPRQRLYGAPYAFTLMPGAVISAQLSAAVYGTALDGVSSVYNLYTDGDADINTGPALPALKLAGEHSLELAGGTPARPYGTIFSDPDFTTSELQLWSRDDVEVNLDYDNSGTAFFRVNDNTGSALCYINEAGNLDCTGTKSAVVSVDAEARKLYAIESPEVWFEDFGSAALVGGAATVTLDSLFAKTVNAGVDYHVFLTPLGDCNGLYVSAKGPGGFEVHELGGGASDVAFDYRIVAKRTGYEDVRLDLAEDLGQ